MAVHGLWLTKEIPEATRRGDLKYSAGLMAALAATGVDLTVIGFRQDGQTGAIAFGAIETAGVPGARAIAFRPLRPEPVRRVWSLVSALPSDAFRTGTQAFRAAIGAALAEQQWRFVVLEHVAMGWAVDVLRTAAAARGLALPPIVYVAHNHEATAKRIAAATARDGLPVRLAMRFDAWKNARLEAKMVGASTLVTTITADDLRRFEAQGGGAALVCLPPGYDGKVVADRVIDADVPRRCVVFGSAGWIAKKHALAEFLCAADPLFLEAGIGIDLVGNIEPGFGAMLARTFRSCRFVGVVDDPAPALAAARIGVSADRSFAGFKLKYLDYAFHRLPIATLASETSGMPVDTAADILCAADHQGLAAAITAAIDDFAALNRMQNATFAKFAAYFNWPRTGETFAEALARLGAGA